MSLALEITRALSGDWHGSYGSVPAPGHSNRDRGVTVRDSDDGDDVIAFSHHGDDWRAIKDEWRRLGLLPERGNRPTDWQSRPVAPARQTPAIDPEQAAAASWAKAERLWREGVDVEGTLAASYLAIRRLDWLPDYATSLRYHPSCPFGDEGERFPCLLSLWRNVVTDAPQAVQRTAISPRGDKVARRNSGSLTGAAVKLAPIESGGLGVAEGLETAMTVMQETGTPTWAMGPCQNLATLPIIPGVALAICADNDDSGLGQNAAAELARRWVAAGQKAWVHTPPPGDFNDLLRAGDHG